MDRLSPYTKPTTKATLPFSKGDTLHLDPLAARKFGEELSGAYCFAEPFPHIVIDDFLPAELIEDILGRFSNNGSSKANLFESALAGLHKKQILPWNCDSRIRDIFNFFNSAPILQFLEGLTAIDALIGDPYFSGGGFHETFSGGKLGIHADFQVNEQLYLHRRINLIIYLNKNWEDSYGGELELWEKEVTSKAVSVAPLFNRAVIFSTGPESHHGHPEPLNTPVAISRKSMALYYYTASRRIVDDVPTYSTMYSARPEDSDYIKRLAFRLRLENYLRDLLPPMVYRFLLQHMRRPR